jgi:hypothetical protein
LENETADPIRVVIPWTQHRGAVRAKQKQVCKRSGCGLLLARSADNTEFMYYTVCKMAKLAFLP